MKGAITVNSETPYEGKHWALLEAQSRASDLTWEGHDRE